MKKISPNYAYYGAVCALVIGYAAILVTPFARVIDPLAPALTWFYIPLATAVIGSLLAALAKKTWLIAANLLPLLVGFPGLWFIGTLLFGP